jgi:uncharacterized membrane protein
VALPLAFSAVAVIFSLLFTALALVAAFGFSGIMCMVIGGGVVLYSFSLLVTEGFPTAIYFIGSGLLTIGVGGLLTRFGWWICALLIRGAKYIGIRFINKIKRNKGGSYEQR